ncbi:MAG TPA: RNA polymerase sigma factor [Pyrinomonadaceae bacterium]|jgi:RNA polymerase sigma-70 factor (ECF subfamily)|nr:RNA polymerase sigma factor [Pyrinomonadaceae bacterium]
MIDETIKINPVRNVNLSATKLSEPSEITDDELVKLVLAGDEAAFACLFERYRKLVVHLVSRFFRQRQEIEDIVQQAFTKIYFALKDFRGGHDKSFSAWASRLTVNACYDELRRRRSRAENLFSEFTDEERTCFEQIAAENSPNAEKSLVTKDLAEKVLAQLDAKERLALTLLHGEDFSVAEVARLVGWSESNVKTRLFRCRNNLRNIFRHLFS